MHSIKANSILRIEPFSKRVQIACALLLQINNIKAFPPIRYPEIEGIENAEYAQQKE